MLQFIFVGHFQSVSKYLNVKNMRLKYVYNILLKQAGLLIQILMSSRFLHNKLIKN